MQDADRRTGDMFERVREFFAIRADSVTPKSRAEELLAALDEVIKDVNTHAAAQTSGKAAAQSGTQSKGAAREALIETLEAMRRTARAIALDNPAFVNNFRLPRGRLNDQELLAIARSFAADAAPVKDEFIHYDMPADFLEDLNADIESFEQACGAQNRSTDAHIAATAALSAALERGLNIVRQLDAIVRNKFRDDRATLAAWTSARHIERAPKRKSAPTQTPPPPSK
jgi:hypothetical protein